MKPFVSLVNASFAFGVAFLSFLSSSVAQTNLPSLDLQVAFPNLSFSRPLWMQEIPDGSKRMVVVEQGGVVYLLPNNRNGTDVKTFLDISERRPYQQNEEGLLALAFHPGYKTNGLLYIFYSQQNPKRSVLSEIHVSKTDPDKVDLSTERVLLQNLKPQPSARFWNHNGGTLLFGPDGCLYLSIGDGGLANDPHNNGQNLGTLLAKIIRIDVNSRTGNLPYGIPKDNPFVNATEGASTNSPDAQATPRPEIWAYGLRNVWRMSFDKETGQLWAGDVGQDRWEEIDIITKGGNYGWSVREAFHPFKEQQAVTGSQPIDPVIEYGHNPRMAAQSKFPNHSIGISITGGYLYRGKKIRSLRGVYVYADFQMGTIWGLRYEDGKLTADEMLVTGNPLRTISSFAEDLDGELYVLSFDGRIYEFTEKK